jgi:hypothetical protein
MTEIVVGFIVGVLVGWNILPQPQWVKNLWDKVLGK